MREGSASEIVQISDIKGLAMWIGRAVARNNPELYESPDAALVRDVERTRRALAVAHLEKSGYIEIPRCTVNRVLDFIEETIKRFPAESGEMA